MDYIIYILVAAVIWIILSLNNLYKVREHVDVLLAKEIEEIKHDIEKIKEKLRI